MNKGCIDCFYYGIVDVTFSGDVEWGCTRKNCIKYIETKLNSFSVDKKHSIFAVSIIDDIMDDLLNVPVQFKEPGYEKALQDVIEYLKESRKVFVK